MADTCEHHENRKKITYTATVTHGAGPRARVETPTVTICPSCDRLPCPRCGLFDLTGKRALCTSCGASLKLPDRPR